MHRLVTWLISIGLIIAMAVQAGCRSTSPRSSFYDPSPPEKLAWLADCTDVVVAVAPPFVAPPEGLLGCLLGRPDMSGELLAHRERLQDGVGHVLAKHLKRVLPVTTVHYSRSNSTYPVMSLPPGLVPSTTALCMVNFEVIVRRGKPFLVKETYGPLLVPMPERWPEIPANALMVKDRGFMESESSARSRALAGYKVRPTPAPQFRGVVAEWQAFYESCWRARPAERSINTLEAGPTWSEPRARTDPSIPGLRIIGEVEWDIPRLESEVSNWAELRGKDLAEQVLAALRLCGAGPRSTQPAEMK